MEQLERARLAMEEYKILHADILQRNGMLMLILAGGMAGIVVLIGLGSVGNIGTRTAVSLIALVALILAITCRLVHVDNKRASRRIVEIEQYINRCVGGDSINPLSWQRRLGFGAPGYLSRYWSRSS